MTLSPERLQKLEVVAKAATPGPWFLWPSHDGSNVCALAPVDGDEPVDIADCDMDRRVNHEQACANASHAAAFDPPTALALIAMAGEAVRLREAQEKREDDIATEAYQEGYSEGENDCTAWGVDVGQMLIRWLEKHADLDMGYYPDGISASELADFMSENIHEVDAAHQRELSTLRTERDKLAEALREIAACDVEHVEGVPVGYGPPVLSAEQMAARASAALGESK